MIKLRNGFTYETADVCFTEEIETLLGFAMDVYYNSTHEETAEGFLYDFFHSEIGRQAVDRINSKREYATDDLWQIWKHHISCTSINTDSDSEFQLDEIMFSYNDLTHMVGYSYDWYDGDAFSCRAKAMRLD